MLSTGVLIRRCTCSKPVILQIAQHRHLTSTLSLLNRVPDKNPGVDKAKGDGDGDVGGEARDKQASPVDEYLNSLRPKLDRAHSLYQSTRRKTHQFVDAVKLHYAKAKQSIKDANVKLAQQEKELATYDFNEDFTSDRVKAGEHSKIEGLPSERERRRKLWAKKLDLYMDSLQETIFTATRALNDVTGYSSIQKLRQSIDALEKELEASKLAFKDAKQAYDSAISKRLESQREVNELLQRKSTWTPADLERFTTLYRDDHINSANEKETKIAMDLAEQRQEELYDKLSNAILTRYHEEQIWSDKIRRTSTWGTFALMGVNIILFLVFQLALEPWKRRRLVGNFESKVQQVLDENSKNQNEKLDIMTEKMESLKQSDIQGFQMIEEGICEEVTDDIDDLFVTPPIIQELPLPLDLQCNHYLYMLKALWDKIVEPFREPWLLITNRELGSLTIQREELLSVLTVSLVLGTILGMVI